MKKLARRTGRENVRDWSRHEGRHAFDGYLEDVMALHAQGVDAADDQSARVFVKDGKVMLVSTNRETLTEIGRALQSGRCGIVGKLAKRPDEDTLEQMLRDAPFSRGLPAPGPAPRALPAHEDAAPAPRLLARAPQRDDADDAARPGRGGRRG